MPRLHYFGFSKVLLLKLFILSNLAKNALRFLSGSGGLTRISHLYCLMAFAICYSKRWLLGTFFCLNSLVLGMP